MTDTYRVTVDNRDDQKVWTRWAVYPLMIYRDRGWKARFWRWLLGD